MRNKRGQSILEYVIVLTVIVAAIAVGANTVIKRAVDNSMNNVETSINNATGRLPGVH